MQENNRLLVTLSEAEFFAKVELLIDSKLAAQPVSVADELPELLTREQAAEFFGVSKGSIDGWARAGKIQKHYAGSRSPRFKRSELRDCFENEQG